MILRKTDIDKIIDEHLGLHGSPSLSEVEDSRECTIQHLRSKIGATKWVVTPAPPLVHPNWRLRLVAVAAITIFAVAVLIQQQTNEIAVYAMVESADRGLSLATGQELRRADRIEVGEAVRTSTEGGAVLKLADGSRVEMRSNSDLVLETASDGVRIRLNKGDVIVNAAKQPAGHLYVQTREMMVFVVGTVFLVNAEEVGSRVAVIEGEVRVQLGLTKTKLRPGEQLTSNPVMERPAVREEISWSREASTHVALLQQSATAGVEKEPEFEVDSIRPARPIDTTGGRGSGPAPGAPCPGNVNLDPGRLIATNITFYRLITMAYATPGQDCTFYSRTDFLADAPAWVTTDRFDVELLIPRGTPEYTKEQLQNGQAPKLQAMLRILLTKRSRLAVRREIKETSAYALKLGTTKNSAELRESGAKTLRQSPINYAGVGSEETFVGVVPTYKAPSERPTSGDRSSGRIIYGRNEALPDLVQRLTSLIGRPVVDQTEVTGKFSYEVVFDIDPDSLPGIQALTRPLNDGSISTLRRAIEQQLGLKLDPTRVTGETLVIERIDRPSEN